MNQSSKLPNNAGRVSFGRLARDSVFELILTSVLLFGVVSIVRWVIGPSRISGMIPGIHAELWVVGAAALAHRGVPGVHRGVRVDDRAQRPAGAAATAAAPTPADALTGQPPVAS